jgi:NAD(P)-dependent dehydrogenase (short-subunit alcohol dehydrogenase family)
MMLTALAPMGMTEEMLGAAVPMGRMARPEEQAEAAVWLCSPRASFVTGVVLPVTGGAPI